MASIVGISTYGAMSIFKIKMYIVKTAVFSWMCHFYYVFSISKQLQIDRSIPGKKSLHDLSCTIFVEVEIYRAVDTVRTTLRRHIVRYLFSREGPRT
jgi:hypothetical protein